MQTNHFSEKGVSLKSSVANIPWMGSSFIGFISGLWLYDRLIQFNTYNGTSLMKLRIDTSSVELVMQNSKYEISILAHRDQATSLASPIKGLMDGRIEESMSSKLDLEVFDKKNRQVLFSDTGHHAGLEVAGDISRIIK
jgi:hypothetical protein